MVLPNWLYEPLPYLYAGMGAVAIFGLESPLGKLSGALLISAGGVISYQRYQFRRVTRERQERLEWLQEERRKRKEARHVWLQEQHRIYEERIAKRDEDF